VGVEATGIIEASATAWEGCEKGCGSVYFRGLAPGPNGSPQYTGHGCKIGPVDALTELGILLRRWRERVTPADVGLPTGTRRRVRGLRRQEVAQLSGVSADYIVELEQGRATSPSTQVLAALARALRLSNFERNHLLRLAGYGPPADHAPTPSAAARRLVDQLDSTPAAIYDPCWNPLTWNPMWAAVNGDPLSRPARARNMMWSFMAGLPSRVKRSPDQALHIQEVLVGDLRARMGQHARDARLTKYVADLSSTSDHFRNIWASEHIAAYRHEEKVIHHPDAGILTLDCDVLTADNNELRLVVYTARRHSETTDRLQQLQEAVDQAPDSRQRAG
jgi:transcriptional regulator with XRE-family HTH domain